MRWNLVNVVATADLRQPISLELVGKLDWGLYDLAIYPAAYVKTTEMVGKVTTFQSGKLISVGTRSISRARWELHHVTNYLAEAGLIKLQKISVRVRNLVVLGNFGFPIDLELLARQASNVMYEPEQFPGAILRLADPEVSILLFASGKLIIAGPKDISSIKFAAGVLSKLAEPYRVDPIAC